MTTVKTFYKVFKLTLPPAANEQDFFSCVKEVADCVTPKESSRSEERREKDMISGCALSSEFAIYVTRMRNAMKSDDILLSPTFLLHADYH